MRMSSRVVITGAAGFIGRNVVAELNARGVDDLLLVDNLGSDEKWRNLVGLRYEEILDSQQFMAHVEADVLPGIDAVIHLGACSATTEPDAGFLLRNNYQYTRALCEWSLRHGARFIYASSAATYGDGSIGYDDDPAVLQQLEPLNMYGYSKHMFDLWAQRHGLFDRIAGLKYFNVYGPNEDHKEDMRSVVHKSYEQIKSTGIVRLFKSYRPEYADGEQLRDFIFVKDAVAMTLYFIENRTTSGLFNCGTGQARSWKALATAVFAAMDIPPSIEYVEMPESLRGKYQYFTQAQMARMRAAGYSAPFTPLEDGVKEYVTGYLALRKNA
jgi:ADP-L-glycero-D-manno-heptose 6-epimerase